MAVTDAIQPYESGDDNGDGIGLNARQIQALEWLSANDAEPAQVDPETKRPAYSKDPKVRAYQMIFEGRLGGPGRGQGRKAKPRAAEHVAEEVRKRSHKIVAVLDRGLDAENPRLAVETAIHALKIEREERELQLREEKQEHDLEAESKEDLVAAIIALASEASVASKLQESIIELPESEFTEVEQPSLPSGNSTSTESVRNKKRSTVNGNGRKSASGDSGKTENAFRKAKKRRAAD